MFALYLAWAYTPESTLRDLGVTYYPDKYWAAAVPIWVCTAVLYGAWAYEGVNRMSVMPTDAVELIEDQNGVIPRQLDEPDPPVRMKTSDSNLPSRCVKKKLGTHPFSPPSRKVHAYIFHVSLSHFPGKKNDLGIPRSSSRLPVH